MSRAHKGAFLTEVEDHHEDVHPIYQTKKENENRQMLRKYYQLWTGIARVLKDERFEK